MDIKKERNRLVRAEREAARAMQDARHALLKAKQTAEILVADAMHLEREARLAYDHEVMDEAEVWVGQYEYNAERAYEAHDIVALL